MKRKVLAFLLCVCLIISEATALGTEPSNDLTELVENTAKYLLQTVSQPEVGSTGGEWAVLGLARSGVKIPEEYFEGYYNAVEQYVKDCDGELHNRKYTEYSRVTVALTAIGKDPTDVAGYNLLTPLGDYDKTVWQGINGAIWALIALDSGNYAMPQNSAAKTQATRQNYVDRILEAQLSDGGWNLSGNGSGDPDLTGMALQALAKYSYQPKVANAIDRALNCLSQMQRSDGTFASYGNATAESAAQVVVALCELGIDKNDPRFVKDGKTALDGLLSFRLSDGSFEHIKGNGSNAMATEQSFYALVAVSRQEKEQSSLYRMAERVENGVKVPTVAKTAVSFPDTLGHTNQAAVEKLASRGILTGGDGGLFLPDKTMTRAEFATTVTRALGLSPEIMDGFSDVTEDKWYAGYVGTAARLGIVAGVGGGRFNPDGTISRQEAAVMVARAAKLCGMNTNFTAEDQQTALEGVETPAAWSREAVAFCLQANILASEEGALKLEQTIGRGEIAQMICNMLTVAGKL